jgi:hypothetical protein
LVTVKLIDDTFVNTFPGTLSTTRSKLPEVLLLEQKRLISEQREPVMMRRLLVLVTVTVVPTKAYWEGMVTTTISPDRKRLVVLIVSVNC